jgi:bacterioferritin (cytochrome b1)
MTRKAAAKSNSKDARGSLSREVEELLYQALETELGGVEVYRTALRCAQNEELREEWTKYLAQTESHVRSVQELCLELGLDPDVDTPGRQVVRTIGKSLVQAMNLALGNDQPATAELVAAECVVLAETKDHLNWSLLGELLGSSEGKRKPALAEVQSEVEHEEDEHLYHSQGWARELWKQALGLPAQLPPPEEEQDVDTALDAARARGSSSAKRV